MQVIDGRFIYSASDLNNYLECMHLTELSREVALGLRKRPLQEDGVDLIARKADEHEQRHLDRMRERYGDGLVAFEGRAENTISGLTAAEAQTVAAMERGAPLIYQATFFDGQFLGRTDFLRRVEVPCARWSWSYEVIDTKLALSTKPYFLIQICNYSEHLTRIQGRSPEHAYIVLGSGIEKRYRVDDYAAYYRHLKASLLSNVDTLGDVYPYEVKHCSVCLWSEECETRRDDDDHLSLVAAIRRDQIDKLGTQGITTLTQLASATENQRPRRMSEATFANLRAQAAEQHKQRHAIAQKSATPYSYAFRPIVEQNGFGKLPKPARGDIFFDIEGDPLYRPDRGLEYLFGVYLPDEDQYKAFWATDSNRERSAFEQLVDFVVERRRAFRDAHVYHYASYEVSALTRLMGRFASRENEIDNLLRAGAFVDLLPVVRQGLWISQPSYGLKKVEAFYGMHRTTETKGGDDSIVMFESWLASGDDAILEDIRLYNEDDVRSTHQLRKWLLKLREALNAQLPDPIPWRADPEFTEPEDEERSALEHEFLDGLPAPNSMDGLRSSADTIRARWLLGNMLQYHRREQKPEWWKFFKRCENPEDLEEHDRDALASLHLRTDIEPYKLGPRQNTIYTYDFPPQDYHLSKKSFSPYTRKSAGEIIQLNDAGRTIAIKLARNIDPPSLRALIPGTPLPDEPKREAMVRIASMYQAGELGRSYPATQQLLLAQAPRLRTIVEGSVIQPAMIDKEVLSQTISLLDASYLFVQGPPGSGKTTMGAWAIVDLLEKKKRVGIVSNGHKALHNLLRKVEETALKRNVKFNGCHKKSQQTEGSHYDPTPDWPMVRSVEDIPPMVDQICLLASGTTHAWADESLVGRFDYIFIDEAGQIPLADALIASLAGKNIVLLGDPMQLPQVCQGSHPVGTQVSILQHLLGDRATVDPTAGLFLDKSFRMQPQICEFISDAIYEGRLKSDPMARANSISSPGLSGAGLRYLPMVHEGNSRCSVPEAERIVNEVRLLLLGSFAVNGKQEQTITERDILVVAPYNLQRKKITELLGNAEISGVRVGTVDKFQGQEAPVVFYSMTTSSGDDLPRDMEFLFDKNRFNVAISRAQCMSVLVCSPRLLDIRCTSAETMSLVNLLCNFVEDAARS